MMFTIMHRKESISRNPAISLGYDLTRKSASKNLWPVGPSTRRCLALLAAPSSMQHQPSRRGHGQSGSPATLRTAHQRILAAKKEGHWQDALNIIAEMRGQGHTLGTVSYNAAIDACGKAKQVTRALELFDELVAAGNVPDAVTYTALIDSCGRAGMLDQAFALFARCVMYPRPKQTTHGVSQLLCSIAPSRADPSALDSTRRMHPAFAAPRPLPLPPHLAPPPLRDRSFGPSAPSPVPPS